MVIFPIISRGNFSGIKTLPEGFVYVKDVIPEVILDIRYYGTDNFVGVRIDGYMSSIAILSRQAAQALKKANDHLLQQGYALKIFDAYRPQIAVNHFIRWAKNKKDTLTKEQYYPNIDKNRLFAEGYIASKSSHSRGSAIDLTLVDLKSGKEIDMGSVFDFFGKISHHGTDLISPEQAKNREILKKAMTNAGFRSYSVEWWHYTLRNEPYPNTYFDFSVQ